MTQQPVRSRDLVAGCGLIFLPPDFLALFFPGRTRKTPEYPEYGATNGQIGAHRVALLALALTRSIRCD